MLGSSQRPQREWPTARTRPATRPTIVRTSGANAALPEPAGRGVQLHRRARCRILACKVRGNYWRVGYSTDTTAAAPRGTPCGTPTRSAPASHCACHIATYRTPSGHPAA